MPSDMTTSASWRNKEARLQLELPILRRCCSASASLAGPLLAWPGGKLTHNKEDAS